MKHRVRSAPHVTPLGAAALTALSLTFVACAGPPITSPIEGEPVCPDFEVGASHTKMIGGLHYPVQLTIKNGSTVTFKTTLVGLRTDKDLASRILLSDDNETFTVEWAQCENERAPRAVDASGQQTKDAAHYECGNATVYKTEQLTTKKGDPKSHVLTFAAPPKTECWQSTTPPPPPPADTGAPSAAPEAADAGAPADPDAGAGDAGADAAPADADAGAPAASGTATAGAAPAATGTATAGAGPADAGKDASVSK